MHEKDNSVRAQILDFLRDNEGWWTMQQIETNIGEFNSGQMTQLFQKGKVQRRVMFKRFAYCLSNKSPKYNARDILAHEAKRIDVSRMTVHEAKALYLQLKEIFDA